MLNGKQIETMAITMNDLREDWQRAKKAMVAQLDLMHRDPVFPDVNLSQVAREQIINHIGRAISEYDALLADYPPA